MSVPGLPGPWHLERKLAEIRSHVEYEWHRSFTLENVGQFDGEHFTDRWKISCHEARCLFEVMVLGDEVAGAGRLDLCDARGWAAFLESAKLLSPRTRSAFWDRLGESEDDPFQ